MSLSETLNGRRATKPRYGNNCPRVDDLLGALSRADVVVQLLYAQTRVPAHVGTRECNQTPNLSNALAGGVAPRSGLAVGPHAGECENLDQQVPSDRDVPTSNRDGTDGMCKVVDSVSSTARETGVGFPGARWWKKKRGKTKSPVTNASRSPS